MTDQHEITVTDADRAAARDDVLKTSRGTTAGGITLVAMTNLLGAVVAQAAFPRLDGFVEALVTAGLAVLFAAPLLIGMAGMAKSKGIQHGSMTAAQNRVMRDDARRQEFERRLNRALEMSDEEPAAFDVIERGFMTAAPNWPVELLLADNSHAHLDRVVTYLPEGTDLPGCSVASPDDCVAARRAQTQVFPDSEELDACPLLRGRDAGRCSAVCVPVSIMGRTVGVVHALGSVDVPVDDAAIHSLQTLANQAGNRLGMLRVMAETTVQAATDGLTGLINRRTLENQLRHIANDGGEFAFVMADLDHFKVLNDSFGHETGDRALRMFAETVKHELRAHDLACRYGGEEFALALPGAETHDAIEVVERIRQALRLATSHGDAPLFTASFGIAHSRDGADLKEVVEKADQALFAAKDAGRDRTCLDGHAMPVAPTLTALG
ncbi:MAG: GGDEF domain-containing protein [Acidimicrobiia bacterium]|nr:GGDEF domain-containing protein [Acidimicrobiia bacterium]